MLISTKSKDEYQKHKDSNHTMMANISINHRLKSLGIYAQGMKWKI
ncbi:MAG: hypothetical protein ACTHKC_07705 [Candidatus Nitrosocosmicus sp.]